MDIQPKSQQVIVPTESSNEPCCANFCHHCVNNCICDIICDCVDKFFKCLTLDTDDE